MTGRSSVSGACHNGPPLGQKGAYGRTRDKAKKVINELIPKCRGLRVCYTISKNMSQQGFSAFISGGM